ncbi:hypothetical protein ACWDAO_07615 [Streptomyces sp. NPDC001212]|uniref:hypothetical protein n=1 Tax=Streptomyces sp. HYC2 TaxID=2955207 RepID=UPI002481404E|nr:hypothetical protein [Streptomyces sp. HYC2]
MANEVVIISTAMTRGIAACVQPQRHAPQGSLVPARTPRRASGGDESHRELICQATLRDFARRLCDNPHAHLVQDAEVTVRTHRSQLDLAECVASASRVATI